MVKALLPLMPFPPIAWWAAAQGLDPVGLDASGPHRKMSGHNRYRIAAANGPLLLTIPLAGGRDQRGTVGSLHIDYTQDWVKQHWRTLFSAYGRAPFFEHYAPPLHDLLTSTPAKLTDICLASVQWIARELGWKQAFHLITDVQTTWPAEVADFRIVRPDRLPTEDFPQYAQVFGERNGFVPNLSLIDLLMNEGPGAAAWLRGNGPQIAAALH